MGLSAKPLFSWLDRGQAPGESHHQARNRDTSLRAGQSALFRLCGLPEQRMTQRRSLLLGWVAVGRSRRGRTLYEDSGERHGSSRKP